MEAPLLVSLPSSDPEGPGPSGRVRLEGDRIVLERFVIADPALTAFLGERPVAERAGLVERAVRIGLLALQDAGVTVNVDAVRTEFERMVRQAEQVNERAAATLE